MKRSVSAPALGGAIAGLIIPTPAYTQTPAAVFVAPPRTIADITAILDQEKPDAKAVSSMRAAADASPPPGAGRADLARFYYSRCQAHGNLGQTREAIADCDDIRGRSVQRASAASSARAGAANPLLAGLARKAQDLDMQIGARLGLLNNVLALPSQDRDESAVKSLRAEIDQMRAARDAAKRDLAGRFPKYASLLEPVPPSVDDIKAVLRADEAFLSFYFGRDNSFVWAVSKTGPAVFAAIGASAGEIDRKVQALREALEPNATTISGIPPFDVALAHELYKLLLSPVEAGWKPAKNLIVATNGALGLLPLGLLPTAPSSSAAQHPRPGRWIAPA